MGSCRLHKWEKKTVIKCRAIPHWWFFDAHREEDNLKLIPTGQGRRKGDRQCLGIEDPFDESN